MFVVLKGFPSQDRYILFFGNEHGLFNAMIVTPNPENIKLKWPKAVVPSLAPRMLRHLLKNILPGSSYSRILFYIPGQKTRNYFRELLEKGKPRKCRVQHEALDYEFLHDRFVSESDESICVLQWYRKNIWNLKTWSNKIISKFYVTSVKRTITINSWKKMCLKMRMRRTIGNYVLCQIPVCRINSWKKICLKMTTTKTIGFIGQIPVCRICYTKEYGESGQRNFATKKRAEQLEDSSDIIDQN